MFRRVIFLFAVFQAASAEFIRGCYYSNWAQYRQDRGKYMPKDYVSGLCTHVFYAFATMNADFTIHPFEWNDENTDWSVGMYAQVIEWKKNQPGLSVLLSFGGWTYSESNMDSLRAMASTAQNRKTFITSVLQLIKKYNFDGFDVDWEYPTADDKDDFSQLLRDLRSAFDASVPRLLLTAAVSPNPDTIKAGYDAKAITDSLDILNLMAYDFHGAWEMTTGHNSPLYDRNGDKFSISDAAAAWVALGVPKSKISVGLATYGRGWTLAGSDTKVGAAATAASNANTYTKLAGMIAYYEACDLLSKGAQRFFDDAQVSPYLVMGNQWYSYDDADSLSRKLNWIKDNGYAGSFVWTLDFDDFNGKCPNGNGQLYPLISKMKEILTNGNNPFKTPLPMTTGTQPVPSTTLLSITTTTQGQQVNTDPPSTGFKCKGPGLYADPSSCDTFYMCDSFGNSYKLPCPTGLQFDGSKKQCDWPKNVNCKKS